MSETQDNVLSSLKAAANAAHSAFLAASAINPGKAKPLWADSISATNAYLTALNATLGGDPQDIKNARDALDKATQRINDSLGTLKNVSTAIQIVAKLIELITGVMKFFA